MKILLIVMVCLLLVCLFYLLMIMPRILHKPDMEPFVGRLYAHRGLHDNASDAPENSLRAFEKAAVSGFGIELDVQMTKDGIPVVFHDFTLKRICGAEGKVCDHTLEELRQFPLCGTDQRIPTFGEALKLIDGRVPLIVELKIERMDTAVCGAADRLLSGYRGLYCIESFHPLALLWYRRNRPEIVRGQLSDAFYKEGYRGTVYFTLQNLLFNWLGKPDFVAYHHIYPNILSRRICRGIYGNTAAAWTIKSEKELQAARDYFDMYIFDSFLPKREAEA